MVALEEKVKKVQKDSKKKDKIYRNRNKKKQ